MKLKRYLFIQTSSYKRANITITMKAKTMKLKTIKLTVTYRIKTIALVNWILVVCLQLIERNDLNTNVNHYHFKVKQLLFTIIIIISLITHLTECNHDNRQMKQIKCLWYSNVYENAMFSLHSYCRNEDRVWDFRCEQCYKVQFYV